MGHAALAAMDERGISAWEGGKPCTTRRYRDLTLFNAAAAQTSFVTAAEFIWMNYLGDYSGFKANTHVVHLSIMCHVTALLNDT